MSLADDYALLVDEARRLAKSVPQPVIEVLVGALHDFDADEWITSRNRFGKSDRARRINNDHR